MKDPLSDPAADLGQTHDSMVENFAPKYLSFFTLEGDGENTAIVDSDVCPSSIDCVRIHEAPNMSSTTTPDLGQVEQGPSHIRGDEGSICLKQAFIN